MEKEAFDIWEETYDVPGLPAILYGKPSPNLLIYIHGEHETEFNEEELAEAAEKDGFQFLSVTMEDVQNHVIWNGPRFDMRVVENYTHFRWPNRRIVTTPQYEKLVDSIDWKAKKNPLLKSDPQNRIFLKNDPHLGLEKRI